MKTSIILILLVSASKVCAEVRLVDGKPQYAIATVNGVTCWTVQERDALIAKSTVTAVVVDVTPDKFTVNLTTSGLSFSNYSDLAACLDTTQSRLADKIDDLSASRAKQLAPSVTYLKEEIKKR